MRSPKVIVQMSVEFAQQSELARISKRDLQTTSSMQTQPEEELEEEEEEEEQERETQWISPRVPGSSSIQTPDPKMEKKQKMLEKRGTSSLKASKGCGKLETEVRELTSEVVRLKEQLRNAAWAVQKVSGTRLCRHTSMKASLVLRWDLLVIPRIRFIHCDL